MSRARATQQPQYDFLSGSPPSQLPVRDSNRPPRRPQEGLVEDNVQESLRAEVHRLQYEIESLRQEKDVTSLRHQEELRAVEARAEADYKRAQQSQSSNNAAASKHDGLLRDFEDYKEQVEVEREDLRRQIRISSEALQTAREESEEAREETRTQERQFKHDMNELRAKSDAAEKAAEELRIDRDEKSKALAELQQKDRENESRVLALENDVLQAKAQSSDTDTLGVIKRELSDQVAHIQKLEAENTDFQIEVRRLRKQHKAVEVVEEEKLQLEAKVRSIHDLRKELDEAHLQKQILLDEKRSWTAYLEDIDTDADGTPIYTPEDLARAYTEERLQRASLIDQLGQITPQLSAKEDLVQSLQDQIEELQSHAKTSKEDSLKGQETKTVKSLERQSALSQKEVEYLRAQLKTYDDEQGEFAPEKHDKQKSQRIGELEGLVDQYRKEISQLNADLKAQRKDSTQSVTQQTGSKRQHGQVDDERLGELRRRAKAMQAEIEKLTTSRKILKKELEASRTQITTLRASSQRILELRDNPTAKASAVKTTTLETLRAENVALLAKLKGKDSSASVPRATLERLRDELAEKDRLLAEKDKFAKRHREMFASKGLEFKTAVASLLGWDLNIMPNGRVRVSSIFYNGKNDDEDDDEPPGSIVFDGERQTMKVSGGPQSTFAKEIQDQIKFWVDGRNEIPCFLAACTLEFYDRTTRAQKI